MVGVKVGWEDRRCKVWVSDILPGPGVHPGGGSGKEKSKLPRQILDRPWERRGANALLVPETLRMEVTCHMRT
jgi:hypothetical protein